VVTSRSGCTWGLAVLLLVPPGGWAADDWKFDLLRLKNGKTFPGLLVEEKPDEIRFQCVRRHPGSPTVVIFTAFARTEIDTIIKLDAKERATLAARLKALDPTGKGEASRMEDLDLQRVPWLKPGQGEALKYASQYFVLASNAREDIVRRAAVRLEQIYGAYARFLPPRQQSGQPTTILLVRSLAEYRALRRDEGRNSVHPAFYDTARNQVICASDLQDLGDELEQIRKHHNELLTELKQLEADLNKQYKGAIPPRIRRYCLTNLMQEIDEKNRKNDRVFADATQQLFQTLYHEAFHAYLANFVYAGAESGVPRWLNEGLAQIFETALVEAGELRVGHADPQRLDRLKSALRRGELVPLAGLLQSGPEKFIVAHAFDQHISDRYYLNSWGLAFYLTFERRLVGTPALDRYVAALKRGGQPLAAFRQLVGKRLDEFEVQFQQYLLKLRPDGTTARSQIDEGRASRP
jgi:hypothetical protein